MSEMVERVAKAIKESLAKDYDEVYFRDDGDTCTVDGHVRIEALARAAIEAMSGAVDDEDFLEQFHLRAYDGRFAKSGETYPVYRNFIRAFFDAALKE